LAKDQQNPEEAKLCDAWNESKLHTAPHKMLNDYHNPIIPSVRFPYRLS
jgi:hypothetical protein